jgi:hypothetical protein
MGHQYSQRIPKHDDITLNVSVEGELGCYHYNEVYFACFADDEECETEVKKWLQQQSMTSVL